MKLKQTGKLAPVNKPWQLIRDAVSDLTLQEKTPGIKIDMTSSWHMPYWGECHQCLAGVVISRRLGADTEYSTRPSRFPDDTHNRLLALDCFRLVFTGLGLKKLGYSLDVYRAIDTMAMHLDYVEYGDKTKSEFKAQLLEMADIMEANLTLKKTLRAIPKKIK